MSKVIVERPRLGGSRRRKGRARPLVNEDGEALGSRHQAADPPRGRTKSLNENLAPLIRYLERQVGRPWDKVHSEISAQLRPTSTVQQHVLDHLSDFVATRAYMEDGVVMTPQARTGRPVPLSESWVRLYVHPKTGLLTRNPSIRAGRRVRAKPVDIDERRHVLGPFRQAHRLKDGAWWDVVLEPIPTRRVTVRNARNEVVERDEALPFVDAIQAAGLSDLPLTKLYGREGVHAVSMRRLPPGERKRLGLP